MEGRGNRWVGGLGKFFSGAKATERIQDLPTDAVKGVDASPRAPKALEKRELDRLIRAVEKESNKRDLAIVLTLRHTGLRVSERQHDGEVALLALLLHRPDEAVQLEIGRAQL